MSWKLRRDNDAGLSPTSSLRSQSNPRAYAKKAGQLFRQSGIIKTHRLCKRYLRNIAESKYFKILEFFIRGIAISLGLLIFIALITPFYDKALVMNGRTEVLSVRLDNAAFGKLDLPTAVYRSDPEKSVRKGRMQLDVSPGTRLRFERIGGGALRLTFAAGPEAVDGRGCAAGLHVIGSAMVDKASVTLCDAATIVMHLAKNDEPLVVALSGEIMVGEEVSVGSGASPVLLEATGSLLVKHDSWLFRSTCLWETLRHFCSRFVANNVTFLPGDSIREDREQAKSRLPAGMGFIRLDPNDSQSGMIFNYSASASAFVVQRMQGETFLVRESLFDVIKESPVVRTLGIFLGAVKLIGYFLKLPNKSGIFDSKAAAAPAVLPRQVPPHRRRYQFYTSRYDLLLAALLLASGAANAQQALVKAGGTNTGQSLLRSRGDRCYAVTPFHVLGSETSALVTALGHEQGEGDLIRQIPAALDPVALLALRGISLKVCPPFEGVSGLDNVLRTHANATLQLVRADGSADRVPLLLSSVEVETLEVRSEAGSLEQGMSGGVVLVLDQPVGLLVSVSEEGHVGQVARLDRISERLQPYLTDSLPLEAAHAPTGSLPYDIIRSTTAPVASANKVSSLQGDGPGPWRVLAGGRIELVLKVTAPFSGIALDLTNLPDPPQTVEVLGGRSAQGPWQSLVVMSLEPGDGLQQRRFLPVSLGYVLLRAYASLDRGTLAVTRVIILPR